MDTAFNQLDFLISKYEKEENEIFESERILDTLTTRAVEAISRIAGPSSEYSKKAQDSYRSLPIHLAREHIWTVVFALRDDVEAGWLSTIKETIHADVFGDYIEMAEHLLDKGFKDPAAVIIGSTLENHIKQLCEKHEIETEGANGRPAKLDTLNAQLSKNEIYSKLDQKSITAWSGLRNDAAHGDYDKYTLEQVRLLLDGVRNFIIRLPA